MKYLLLLSFSSACFSAEPPRIALTLIDATAPHYATFQSNNQKVVQNSRGIFMTHVHDRDAKYNAQLWRVSWSQDSGKTFTTLFEATAATNPPCLETDSADNLYIGHPDWVTMDVILVRLLAAEDYRQPHITRVPKSAAGKYSMALDEARQQVMFFSHSGKFIRYGLDGSVRSDSVLLKHGPKVVQEYTHLH
jgi:hypothetical protein